MRNSLLLLSVVVIALAGAWFLTDRSSAPSRLPVARELPPPELPEPPPEEAPPEAPPLPTIAIHGRVLRGGEGVARVVVEIGDETATTDPFGVFEFPARERSRKQAVRVLAGADDSTVLATWEDALTAARPADMELARQEPTDWPAVPSRALWTLHLDFHDRARTASGGDGHAWLRFEEALIEGWGRGGRIRLRGTARFPDGARVDASLYFEGLRFLSTLRSGIVESGTFETEIYCNRDLRLFSGTYDAHVTYNQILQSMELRKSLGSGELKDLQETTDRVALFLGDPDEAHNQDLRSREYYGGVLEQIRFLNHGLESRVEEVRRLSKGWNPALYQARAAAREGWFHVDFFDAEGVFQESRWRDFLDRSWRPEVQDLRRQHQEIPQQKYQEAERHVERALTALWRLSFIYSRFVVYPLFSLENSPRDDIIDEEGRGDVVLLRNMVKRAVLELERFPALLEEQAAHRPMWHRDR